MMMSWVPGLNRKKVVCFIDDDPKELRRFEVAMKSSSGPEPDERFEVVTATTYEDCTRELRNRKLKPDIWVLDLYFPKPGVVNDEKQPAGMAHRYADLEQNVRTFQAYLADIG